MPTIIEPNTFHLLSGLSGILCAWLVWYAILTR